jgi:small conductance mechanosensitive channel
VVLLELGSSSINWQVRVWANTSEYWDIWQATTRLVKKRLDEAGIGIPFPQMDVHLDGALSGASPQLP